jgi:hypothetical protein
MISQERSPALRWRAPSPRHVLRNGGLADIDAELEELSMNAGSAPSGWQGSSDGSAAEFPALRSACRHVDAISTARRSESQLGASG